MSNQPPEPNNGLTPLDRATAGRLARLRTMPVDVSRLAAAVEARVPRPARGESSSAAPSSAPSRRMTFGMPQSLRAVAASLLVVGAIVAAFVASSGGPVLASVDHLADLHRHTVAGHAPTVAVTSIDEAGRVLSAKWGRSGDLPELAGGAHVMACCVNAMGGKPLSCVTLSADGTPVTMTVAASRDVRMPTANAFVRNGVTFGSATSTDVNMVMTARGDRWVCLMGRLSLERLADLAATLKF